LQRHSGHPRRVSAIAWNAVRDGNGITVRHQWNAQWWKPEQNPRPLSEPYIKASTLMP
jgi:hypothetical protein